MVQQKINYRVVSLFIFSFFFFSSCKKLKNEEIGIRINAFAPHDGTPLTGVKYIIIEEKAKKGLFSGMEQTDWRMEGKTDPTGKATIVFKPKRNKDYSYTIIFDYSEVEFPPGEWDYINQPTFRNITREFMSKQNTYEITALPRVQTHFKIENVNCFDENDSFRFKSYNYDANPTNSFEYINSWSAIQTGGCGIKYENTSATSLAGRHLFFIEVTRNGQKTEYVDTFDLQPNTLNELFLEY